MKTIHADNQRAWFDLEAINSTWRREVVRQADGSWKLQREAVRERVGRLAWEGINGMRVLPFSGWNPDGTMQTAEEAFTPYLLQDGRWELDQENLFYWPIIREVAGIYKEFNVEFPFCLFDNCQFYKRPAWACWSNNVQGIDNYMADIPRSVRFVQRAVAELGDMDNVLFEVVNEGAIYDNLQVSLEWFRQIFRAMKDGGIEPDRVSAGACLERVAYTGNYTFGKSNCLQDWVKTVAEEVWGEQPAWGMYLPVHNVAGDIGGWWETPQLWREAPELIYGQFYHLATYYWGEWGRTRKGILSNDGNKDKDSAQARETWKKVCYALLTDYNTVNPVVGRKFVLEYLTDTADLDVKVLAARAMAEGIGTGLLVNYHRKEYKPEPVIDPPECNIGEVKKEKCWDGSEIITHVCNEGRWVATGNVCPVKPPDKPKITWQGWLGLGLIAAAAIAAAVFIF